LLGPNTLNVIEVKMTSPDAHDLVVSLETGEVGVVITMVTQGWWRVSFPSGIQIIEEEDIEVLESGNQKRWLIDNNEKQQG